MDITRLSLISEIFMMGKKMDLLSSREEQRGYLPYMEGN